MGDELMTAGLNAEDARFVAVQLAQNGLALTPADALAQLNRWRDKALDQNDALCIAGMRIAELERALRRLEYWLDTDQEILDAMDESERRVHLKMLGIAIAALTGENGNG
jgi:hypothetical protein